MTSEIPIVEAPPPRRGTKRRFLLWITISFLISLGVTVALREGAGLPEAAAFLVALTVVTAANFCALRGFVYQASGGRIGPQLRSYLTSVAGFRVGEYSGFVLLTSVLGCPYKIAVAVVLVISVVLKHAVYGRLVFQSAPEPEGIAEPPEERSPAVAARCTKEP